MAINQREGFSPEGGKGVLDPQYYADRIREERQRTDRSGKPFSIVIVDFYDLLKGNAGLKVLNGRLKKEILSSIVDATRCTDIKGWYQSDKLGLLCPDTDGSGASILIGKLRRTLEGKLRKFTQMNDIIKDKIILTSLTYPDYINGEQGQSNQRSHSSLQQDMRITEYMEQKDYSLKSGKSILKWKIGFPFFQSNAEALEMSYVHVPIIVSTSAHDIIPKALKRLIDIVGSLLCILVALPVMLAISVIIKVTSAGPVLFKQKRLGQMGKKFIFLKFRSMYTNIDHKIHETFMTSFIEGSLKNDSEKKEGQVYKLKSDPRITPFGRFLRKTSLDELPQLFNVLKGEMSLIGPRPPIPYEVDKYKLWHRKRIMEVKPGITGLWQVSGRSSTTFEEMVRLDLHYVNHWSLKFDFIIMLKTVKALFTMKGAY